MIETRFGNKTAYMCEECGLIYKNKTIAEKCQNWCDKYKSCNLNITRNALNRRMYEKIKDND